MIMIIAIICIFLSYVIFDEQVENYFKRIVRPLQKKSTSPFYSLPSIKFKKCKSPPLFANTENFSGLPCRKWGEDTM